MTEIVINDSDRRIQYTASGGQTVFPYDFPIFDEAHLVVTRLRAGVLTTFALTTDYTVSGGGVEAGGNVTLVSGATAGDGITIYGDTPVERTTDFNDAGDFFAATLNREFDLQTQMIQQNERDIARSLRLQDGDTSTASLLPLAAARASKFLAFDGNGDPIAAAGTSANLNPVSTYIDALLDDTTLAAALASLLFSADMQAFLVTANDAAARVALDAVGLTGNETIVGNKKFSGSNTFQSRVNADNTVGGTVSAITATFNPTFSGALVDKMRVTVRATGANTGAVTFFPDAVSDGAVLVEKIENGILTTLAAGDITGASHDLDLVWNATAGRWILLNPGFRTGVVQVVNYTISTVLGAYAATIPFDNTIPQDTEGTQVMSLAITPKSSTHKLKIEVIALVSSSGTSEATTVALFNAAGDALAATATFETIANGAETIPLIHYMTSGSTSAITFTVNIGSHTNTTTLNGQNGTQVLGGKASSSITITEIAP